MKLFNRIYLLVLAAIFMAACSDDNGMGPGSKGVQVHFAMQTRATSGTGVAEDPVEELQVERFNQYWVVFTDGTSANTVVAIVKNKCSLTERDEFMVTLSPGSYKVYGFANIADSYLESLGIQEGKPMPDLSGTLFTPDNRYFGKTVTTLLPAEKFQADYEKKENQGIPMTSVNGIRVNITNAVTVTTSIEVVRMFAKLEFVFANSTSNDLTLRSQAVSHLSTNLADGTGFIPLYNDDQRQFDFLDDKPYSTLTHNYGTGLQLPQGASGISKSFYVLESRADNITNSFMLDFDVITQGETPAEPSDYMRYALTDPNTLTAIRRNDWIRIPVTFVDWQMRLEAFTYPPIGGYPEAEISETESNEFVVAFDGGGDFSIRPFIRNTGDSSDWFGVDNTEKVVGTPTISVEDTDGIFISQPAMNELGEIRGRMNVVSGKKACITISVRVITSTTPYMTKVLTRKIFVTQK